MRALLVLGVVGCAVAHARPVRAQQCRELRFAFQPDCYRPSLSAACNARWNQDLANPKLDLGPQVAVWLGGADGTKFVDTFMVTSLTATRGLANRPGRWDFFSAPRFPYGKRVMALPVWAHARGRLYPTVVTQDGSENGMGFHEAVSTPDPYYCRPMSASEVDVDAITCPTKVFNSAKGRYSDQQTYYPPRNDLTTFLPKDCDMVVPYSASCAGATNLQDCCVRILGPTATSSADKYAAINDLDAVAAATPEYGHPYQGRWVIPPSLPTGDYTVWVEVNKEYDYNASHLHPSTGDPVLPGSGIAKNFGQPSVVFAVPIRLDGQGSVAAVTDSRGYSDWTGTTGAILPRDTTISNDPGSGEGRLLVIPSPWGGSAGRVHVATLGCGGDAGVPADDALGPGGTATCQPGPVTGLKVDSITDAQAVLSFIQPGETDGTPVFGYGIRFNQGTTPNPQGGSPGAQVVPGNPGTTAQFTLEPLTGATQYVVTVTALGRCGDSAPTLLVFTTPDKKFQQIEGCFIATAAYGSALLPAVTSLRAARDRAKASGSLGRASVELYYRASPPMAAILRDTEPGRALARIAIAPVAGLIEAVQRLETYR